MKHNFIDRCLATEWISSWEKEFCHKFLFYCHFRYKFWGAHEVIACSRLKLPSGTTSRKVISTCLLTFDDDGCECVNSQVDERSQKIESLISIWTTFASGMSLLKESYTLEASVINLLCCRYEQLAQSDVQLGRYPHSTNEKLSKSAEMPSKVLFW